MKSLTKSAGTDAHPLAQAGILAGTRPAPDTVPALPPDHDDPGSCNFVPEELRPYWPSREAYVVAWQETFENLGQQSKSTSTDLPSGLHAAAEWLIVRDLRTKYPRGWPRELGPSSWRIQERSRTITQQDKLDYLHQVFLSRAGRKRKNAEKRAAMTAEKTAKETCTICHQVNSTTALRRLDPQTGDWDPFIDGNSAQLCTPCARVAAALTLEQARKDDINGRTRAAVVAEYLANHPTA